MSKDYYAVLGIPKTASPDQIKKAYKDQARKWHPDRNKDNTTEAKERFQNIGESFEVLSDYNKRIIYDSIQSGGSMPFGNAKFNDNSFKHYSAASFRDKSSYCSNFDDTTNRRFQQQQQQQQQRQGCNSHLRPDPPPNPTANNSRKQKRRFHRPNYHPYPTSNGNTFSSYSRRDNPPDPSPPPPPAPPPPTPPTPPTSAPAPTNPSPQSIKRDLFFTLEELYTGTSKRLKVTRKTRQGTKTDKILTVDIQPGCESGTTILFPGEGDEMADGQVQDIEFKVEEMAHECYSREGDNLLVTVNLTLAEALLGFTKEIMALDQSTIPLTSNTTIQPGQRVRLNRRGMPNMVTGRKGELLVTYNVLLPSDLSDAQKQQISESLVG